MLGEVTDQFESDPDEGPPQPDLDTALVTQHAAHARAQAGKYD